MEEQVKQVMPMLAEMKKEMGTGMEKMDARNKEIDEKMDTRNKSKNECNNRRDERKNGKYGRKNRQAKNKIIISLSEKFQKEVEANKNEIEEIREEMKDVKTNLENMENIVGRNMV
ncbi:hypothetical protein Zmor_006686 [Zophobas morio]|uniref:Uncharacterized protein n=1 Tax=Zophobas morio TaxID=2755281 RepID=A0AA38MNM9_9CUCU|nr:hypothetical protein Zmor_006686 [Zophobas morio]